MKFSKESFRQSVQRGFSVIKEPSNFDLTKFLNSNLENLFFTEYFR